jgi:hypothetical protein
MSGINSTTTDAKGTTTPPDSLFSPAFISSNAEKRKALSNRRPSNSNYNRPRSWKEKTRSTVKKVLGEPEEAPETVHTWSYLGGNKGDVGQKIKEYVLSLFPFLTWAPRYNIHWLFGDLIA